MKKIFLIILMLIPICGVRAEEWKEVTEIPTTTGSTLEIKEEKEYKWYKLRKEGGYFKELPSEEFTKTDFWTYTSWSEWNSEYPENKDVVETRTVYHSKKMKQINYIRIFDVNNEHLDFSVLFVYKGRNIISYNRIEQDGAIILELEEPCYYDELELEMTLINTEDEENAFNIEWLYDLDLPSCMKVRVRQWFQIATQLTFIYRKLMPNQFLYEEEEISLEKIEENLHTSVWESEEYRYKERLDYYEKETKEYYPYYSSIPPLDYIYPDWSTEKTRLFVREHQVFVPPVEIIKEVPVEKIVTKEIPIEKIVTREIPVEKLITKEIPVEKVIVKEQISEKETDLEQEIASLKEENEHLKFRIASSENEQSEKIEVNKTRSVKKQSLGAIYYIIIFLLGFFISRIVAMKKKF